MCGRGNEVTPGWGEPGGGSAQHVLLLHSLLVSPLVFIHLHPQGQMRPRLEQVLGLYHYVNPHPAMCFSFVFREGGREEHYLAALRACPNWGLNPQNGNVL